MRTVTLSLARSCFYALLRAVRTRDERFLITRNGRPVAWLISAAEHSRTRAMVAVRGMQTRSVRAGLSGMRLSRINATIKEVRRERDQGRMTRTKRPHGA